MSGFIRSFRVSPGIMSFTPAAIHTVSGTTSVSVGPTLVREGKNKNNFKTKGSFYCSLGNKTKSIYVQTGCLPIPQWLSVCQLASHPGVKLHRQNIAEAIQGSGAASATAQAMPAGRYPEEACFPILQRLSVCCPASRQGATWRRQRDVTIPLGPATGNLSRVYPLFAQQ